MEASSPQEPMKLPKRRIVDGAPAEISQHPWQVALQAGGEFRCGGSIVAERWVLTAAHCFIDEKRESVWFAKAGATNYTASAPAWTPVVRIVLHPKFAPFTLENDIALVKLKSKTSGKAIQRAEASRTVPVGQELEITGWGATSDGGTGSKTLQKVKVPLTDTAACNAPGAYNGQIKGAMLCAGYPKGGKDACQGDSGGPLVWRLAQNRELLVGVVSWGEGCAQASKYGIYTRVSAYADWIDEVLAADTK
jgi:secreted trypsin-like serine protease